MPAEIAEGVRRLLNNQVIAIPTETVYGLAVDPCSIAAVDALHLLKGRPGGMGMPLLLNTAETIENWVVDRLPEVAAARRLLQREFWPGPLTLVIDVNSRANSFADDVFGPGRSLSFRLSPDPIALALAMAMPQGVITATSANRHGQAPALNASEARNMFPEIYVLEGQKAASSCISGATALVLPSTVIDIRELPVRVIRPGAVDAQQIENLISSNSL